MYIMHHLWETNYITSFPGKKGQRPGTLPFVPQTQNVTETWQKFANFQLGKWMIDKWQFMFKNMSWEFMMFMTFMKQFNVMWWFIILNEDIYILKKHQDRSVAIDNSVTLASAFASALAPALRAAAFAAAAFAGIAAMALPTASILPSTTRPQVAGEGPERNQVIFTPSCVWWSGNG